MCAPLIIFWYYPYIYCNYSKMHLACTFIIMFGDEQYYLQYVLLCKQMKVSHY